MYKPAFDSRKFRNLALYLAHRSKGDPHFGMVKLWTQLYYCDTIAFVRTGKPITGATYEKRSWGFYPREWPAELAKMLGKAAV